MNLIYKKNNNYINIEYTNQNIIKKFDIIFCINILEKINNKKTYYITNINEFYKLIKKININNKKILFITNNQNIKEYTNLLEFILYYKQKSKELNKEIIKYNRTLINKKDNKIIIDAINKFINMNQDGKFIRGCLIDLGYKLNNNDNYSKYLSLAYETFETSILIHDDIIDNSLLRRNKPTISSQYNKELSIYNNETQIHNNLSICIGDLGFYYSSLLINEKYGKNKNYNKLVNYYNKIVINTIKGEIIDVYLPFIEQYNKNNILNENDILEIYRLKTSYYTIIGPFILGMILGNSKQIEKYEKILEPLGIAFQIKDDILGIFSSQNIVGKSTSTDIEEFKQTILYSYIKLNKKDYYKKLINYYGKKNINDKDIQEVQKIIIDSGSLKYANNIMNNLFKTTTSNINNLKIKSNIKSILLGLVTYLELREK